MSKQGHFATKVDLEKAYDRLNQNFIYDTLVETGMPLDLIDVIMSCITSVNMEVIWNSERTHEFKPSSGIHQGDPLSPYIFVLYMEKLVHIIKDDAVQVGGNLFD